MLVLLAERADTRNYTGERLREKNQRGFASDRRDVNRMAPVVPKSGYAQGIPKLNREAVG